MGAKQSTESNKSNTYVVANPSYVIPNTNPLNPMTGGKYKKAIKNSKFNKKNKTKTAKRKTKK